MDPLREVAKAIRPFLPELVGEQSVRLDRELATLLADPADDVPEKIADLLRSNPSTHAWAAEALGDPLLRPPQFQDRRERTFEPLPGVGVPVPAVRYMCPVDGNYVWYRPDVATPVPACPDHSTALVPAGKAA